MQNKVLVVAKRELLKNIRKKSFWVATLLLPLIFLTSIFISAESGKAAEERVKKEAESAKSILILDKANVINKNLVAAPLKLETDFDKALTSVKNKEADVLIVYPEDIFNSNKIQIYTQGTGIFTRDRYNGLASKLIKDSILSQVGDQNKIALFNANLGTEITSYKDGQVIDESYERLVVPIAAVVIYFLLINFANNYMLFSVSEEKENRMIEVVLTSVSPKVLILGKILGQLGTVLTQLLTLAVFASAGLYFAKPNLPFDISTVHVDPLVIVMSIFYTIMGLLILGNIMVSVGAAVPTYKEAQSFSSVFIILSILPIYFFTIILTDPTGTISRIASYFPLTAPLILLFRFGLGVLSRTETLLSMVLLLIYAYVTFVIAVKLFEFGALEYNKKISLKDVFSTMKKK